MLELEARRLTASADDRPPLNLRSRARPMRSGGASGGDDDKVTVIFLFIYLFIYLFILITSQWRNRRLALGEKVAGSIPALVKFF